MKYKTIAIERQYGSGGREIAEKCAERLGIKCYGQEILLMAAKQCGIPAEQLAQIEESTNDTFWDSIAIMNRMLGGDGNVLTDKQELSKLEAEIILYIAGKESCIFLGRGAAFVLGDRKNNLSAFVHADYGFRRNHAINNYNVNPADADKVLRSIDKRRYNYHESYRKLMWGEKEGYDLMLNSGTLGIDQCVSLIEKTFLQD